MIDLRSDTVTRPTAAMRAAMAAAPVGDDVFGDDPTINALQERMAVMTGKQAALFVPSGTMSNQLAVRVHTRPGDELLVHAAAHIYNAESGAAAALAGVQCRPIDSADGTLPEDLCEAAFHDGVDPHRAPTRLICLENTINERGGLVLPADHAPAVSTWARARGVATHLDGARIWHASVASHTPIDALCSPFDTASLCLSKGLGAPVGSVLVGPSALVAQARRFRKMYGGGMRQAGVLAAAAMYALDHHIERLAEDHRRATAFADALRDLASVTVEPHATNIVYFRVAPQHDTRARGEQVVASFAALGVAISGGRGRYRAVFHLDVDDAGLDRACQAARDALR